MTTVANKEHFRQLVSGKTFDDYTPISSLGFVFGQYQYFVCTSCGQHGKPDTMNIKGAPTEENRGDIICNGCLTDIRNPERNCNGCGVRIRHVDRPQTVTYILNGEEHQGEVCRNCNGNHRYHSSYERCTDCNYYHPAGNLTAVEDRAICGNCLEYNYTYCEHCDEHHRGRDNNNQYNLPTANVSNVTTNPIGSVIDSEHLKLLALN